METQGPRNLSNSSSLTHLSKGLNYLVKADAEVLFKKQYTEQDLKWNTTQH